MTAGQLFLSVITCNAPQATIRTVQSSRLPHNRVIVVSNGSCNAADAEIAKALPDIAELVRVRPARGLTHCLNVGIRLPAQRKWHPQPEWTILTQDDVEFDADWLAKLTAAMADRPTAMQFNLAYPKGSYSCLALSLDLVRKMGWWDERFPGMFFEDDDWHLRLSELSNCPPGTRVHEKDKGGIFARVKCARHDKGLHQARNKDRARFGFKTALSKEANRKFFYQKWQRVAVGGWQDKGIPGLFVRRLPEVDPYPRALLGGRLQ